eukprot:jgi/Antlo1/802/210
MLKMNAMKSVNGADMTILTNVPIDIEIRIYAISNLSSDMLIDTITNKRTEYLQRHS